MPGDITYLDRNGDGKLVKVRDKKAIIDIVKDAVKSGMCGSIEDFSCYKCIGWNTCEYAFDLYNTYGDCLYSK